jgi:hypothetical protein
MTKETEGEQMRKETTETYPLFVDRACPICGTLQKKKEITCKRCPDIASQQKLVEKVRPMLFELCVDGNLFQSQGECIICKNCAKRIERSKICPLRLLALDVANILTGSAGKFIARIIKAWGDTPLFHDIMYKADSLQLIYQSIQLYQIIKEKRSISLLKLCELLETEDIFEVYDMVQELKQQKLVRFNEEEQTVESV